MLRRLLLITTIVVGAGAFVFGQDQLTSPKKWDHDVRSFIENKGQFDNRNWQSNAPVTYAYSQNPFYIFFSKQGVTYRFDKMIKNPKRKEDRTVLPKRVNISELIKVNWVGANEEVEIIPSNKINHHYSYAIEQGSKDNVKNLNRVASYEKLLYKNVYKNIDIEYTIHPEAGVKYNVILHAGADPSMLKMKYTTSHTNTLDEAINVELNDEGQLEIKTSLGGVIEHKPFTFYKENGQEIHSKYKFEGNVLSFELEEYDKQQEVVIDPWIISPNFQTSTAVWEVETDAAGNVYAIGGETPMELKKYDPAGNIQWTYVTPWDTSSVWLGTLATDAAGNSYVTSGVTAEMHKVDNAGNFVWQTALGGGLQYSSEWWSITFNCDESNLIVGGTWVDGLFSFDFYAGIFEIDVNNGNVLNDQQVDYTDISAFGATPVEVRSISSSKNARYIFLTHKDVGAINDNLTLCPNPAPIFQEDNDRNLAYKCENYLPETQNGGGLKALIANDNFFYTHTGDQIRQWDIDNGDLINTVALPGGAANNDIFGNRIVHCSGLDVDDCGNVYAGSMDRVVKFDPNLAIISSENTSFAVYDVDVNSNGEVIAGGAQQNNQATNRNGRIESLAMSACNQFELICCQATICPEGPLCEDDPALQLTTATGGGTWSGTGVDASGNFDPSIAGVGNHAITYTLACGSSTIFIEVNPCATLVVCEETNGDLTVTGGVGPYTWQEEGTTSTPITNSTECTDCGYTWTGFNCVDASFNTVTECTSTGWVTYDTGTTTNPPSSYPIQIIDDAGNTIIINSAADIDPCTSTPCTNLTVTITNQTDVTCNGANNGSATVDATDGNGNYTYTWNPGALNGATQSNLAPGTYTVDVVDTDGCDGSVVVEIVEPTAIVIQMSATDAACGLADGSATATVSGGTSGYSYSWSNGGTTATINNLAAGAYDVTVTDANGCQAQASITVQSSNGPDLVVVSSADASCFGTSDGSGEVEATGGTTPYVYTWNPGNLTGPIQNGLSAGTYTVDVEDDDGCITSVNVVIDQPDAITLTVSSNPSSCTVDDGSATVNASGGNGGFTYDWSNGGTTATISNIGAGNYTVVVTDASGCSADTSVNVNSVNGPELTISNVTDVSCIGDADGSATVSVDAGTGTGPFTYDWSPSGGTDPTATNLSPGTYNVTVTDDAGCIAVATVVIGAPSEIIVTGVTNPADCGTDNGMISVTASGGNGGYTYSWDAGVPDDASIGGLTSGDYTVTVTDANGCSVNETFFVGQNDSISVLVTPQNPVINAGSSVDLTATTDPTVANTTFSWSPADGLSCTDCADPTASPETTTTYTVSVITPDGCEGQTSVTVFVESPCEGAFLPTIFSPNGDGLNDVLCLISDCVVSMELSIYNRWGERVFESTDVDFCWDGTHRGKAVNTGVFVYKLRVFLSDGTEVFDSGNLTLVR